MRFLILLILDSFFGYTFEIYDDCSKCIKDSTHEWCTDADFKGDRCFLLGMLKDECTDSIKFQKSKVQPISNFVTDDVMISPQKFKISNLQPGVLTDVSSTIKVPPTLPLDIYIVIDSSESMREARKNLIMYLSKTIDRLSEIGASVIKIGIGLFLDKKYAPVMGRSPYEFEHYINLTDDKTYLQEKLLKMVSEKQLESNNDNPESVFTAVLQAATCEDLIGWAPRKKSIRVIFAATDDYPKTAGDGRSMGIINKYKNICNLDKLGGYQQFTDYPDDNILNHVLNEKDIQLTFLITDVKKIPYYQQIAKNLKEINVNVVFVVKPDDVVRQINIASKRALSHITLIPPVQDEYTTITINPVCDGREITETGYYVCPNPKKGSFSVGIDITTKQCYPDNQTLKYYITIVGFGSVELELSTGCTCDCSHTSHPTFEVKSSKCSFNGNSVCGKCYCDMSYSGKYCECHESTSNCVKPGDPEELICSGIGECKCNQCSSCGESSTSLFSGNYCECDNSNCQSGVDELCSGSTHGICECGKCRCQPRYTGTLCEEKKCDNEFWKSTCSKENGTQECNGKGKCECGRCQCHYGFSGDYCEKEINLGTCNKYAKCALCEVNDREEIKDQLCSLCNELGIFAIDDTKKLNTDYKCVTSFEKCDTYFSVLDGDENTRSSKKSSIIIKPLNKNKDCRPPFSPIVMVIIIAVGIILISLALVLIAWFVKYQYDLAQYQKFRLETDNPNKQMVSNPLFIESRGEVNT